MNSNQCNQCGKSPKINKNDLIDNIVEINKMHDFLVVFKYGSPLDMKQCKFILCEECLMKLLVSFQIKPEWKEYTDLL